MATADQQVAMLITEVRQLVQVVNNLAKHSSTQAAGFDKSAAALNASLRRTTSLTDDLRASVQTMDEAATAWKKQVREDRAMNALQERLNSLSAITRKADEHLHGMITVAERVKQTNQNVVEQAQKNIQQERTQRTQVVQYLQAGAAAYKTNTKAMKSANDALIQAQADQVAKQQAYTLAEQALQVEQSKSAGKALDALNVFVIAAQTSKHELDAANASLRLAHQSSAKVEASVKDSVREYESRKAEYKHLHESIRRNTEAHALATAEIAKAEKTQVDSTNKIIRRGLSFGNALDHAKTKVMEWAKGLKAASVAMATAGGKQIYDQIQSEINRGTNISKQSYFDIASLGLDPKEFVEATGEYRRAMLAAGGLGDSMTILKQSQKELASVMADPKDRTEFTLHNMEMMAKLGIKPTTSNMKIMNDAMIKNIKISGETGAQYMANIRDIVEDESTMFKMRSAASEEEREAMRKGIMQRYAENKAMGMTSEQAKAVAKSMAKMAGEGPIERFKKAAKLQAAFGAMGIAGGEDMAELYRKGKRRTNEEERRFQQGMSQYQNKMSTDYTGTGSEAFFAEAIGSKTGFDVNNTAEFNTNMLKELGAPINKAAESMGQVSDSVVTAVDLFKQAINQITKNPFVEIVAGVSGLALAIGANVVALTANTAALYKSAGSSMMGELDKLTKGRAGKVGGALGKYGSKLGGWGAAARGVAAGGALGVGGAVIGYGADTLKRNNHETAGAWADTASTTANYAGMGAAVGSVIPGLGTAVGAGTGAVIGAGVGLYNNWNDLWGGKTKDDASKAQVKTENKQAQKQMEYQFSEMELMQSGNAELIAKFKARREELLAQYGGGSNATVRENNQAHIRAQAQLTREFGKLVPTATNLAKPTDLIPTSKNNAASAQERYGEAIAEQTKSVEKERSDRADTVSNQLNRMDKSNEYLKVVADMMPMLVQLASKQLDAMAMTDKQKEDQDKKPSTNSLKGTLGFLGL